MEQQSLMLRNLRKGAARYCLLQALESGPRYPRDLAQEMETVLAAGTPERNIYTLLMSVTALGFVATHSREGDGQTARRNFELTLVGATVLASFRRHWPSYRDAVDAILSDDPGPVGAAESATRVAGPGGSPGAASDAGPPIVDADKIGPVQDEVGEDVVANLRRGTLRYCLLAVLASSPRNEAEMLARLQVLGTTHRTVQPAILKLTRQGLIAPADETVDDAMDAARYELTAPGRDVLDAFIGVWIEHRDSLTRYLRT